MMSGSEVRQVRLSLYPQRVHNLVGKLNYYKDSITNAVLDICLGHYETVGEKQRKEDNLEKVAAVLPLKV